jgi:hypothetical protein
MANKLFRLLPALSMALLVGALSTAAFATGPASDPSYVAGEPHRDGSGDWNVVVMNDNGWGERVHGETKKQAKEAADAKAAELNANGGEGCYDICLAHPDYCG